MINTFLSNKNASFLNKIKNSLNSCNSFSFSVSFIKMAGLNLLSSDIENALSRGVKGRIITSTYQNFTDIASLEKYKSWMDKYPNFDCHIDFNCFGENGFHSKGYIFDFDDHSELVVGSSNITRFALLKNIEWNVSIEDASNFDSLNSANYEFDELWKQTLELSSKIINEYKVQLDYAIEKWDMDYISTSNFEVKPNAMQRKALKNIRRLRDMGHNKALVISATGSGKTFLAAFDAKNYDAKRLLFVVHRDNILLAARDSFIKVFGSTRTYGMFTGNKQELDCDFIFASNHMLSRHLNMFSKQEFDYIVIDECHHAVASTYRTIMEYFNAGFTLGLTATPERMDNEDIFELFDENVPFELRLRDAIINDLIVPFHYYGIRNKLVDYSSKISDAEISREIAKTTTMEFITSEIERIKKLEIHGEKLKCLIFCSSISHSRLVNEELNKLGYNSITLNGENTTGERLKGFNDLQNEENGLEMICTVDILNEGIDIPAVNMVIFLRPTESQTIFIQQLGRGLRKYKEKKYVSVLDFIGNNYDRSVQIALALSTLSPSSIIEKKYLTDLVRTNFESLDIPGVKIDIDALSREEIISYIGNTNFNLFKFLAKDFENFNNYLGKSTFPTHLDFLHSDCAPDLIRLIKSKKGSMFHSYYNFLKEIDPNKVPLFDKDEIKLINNISDLLPISRPDEFLIIKQLIDGELNIDALVSEEYNRCSIETLKNALFFLEREGKNTAIVKNGKLNVQNVSSELKEYLEDLVEYGLQRCKIEFGNFNGPFKLYGNYYKSQIARELLRTADMIVKGTEYNQQTKETYAYVGLNKDRDAQERLNYKDKFLSRDVFQWESVVDTTVNSAEGKKLLGTKVVHLFIRKMESEDGVTLPFTYFGTGKFTNLRESHVEQNNNGVVSVKDTLLFDIVLDNTVPEELCFDFEIPEGDVN